MKETVIIFKGNNTDLCRSKFCIVLLRFLKVHDSVICFIGTGHPSVTWLRPS